MTFIAFSFVLSVWGHQKSVNNAEPASFKGFCPSGEEELHGGDPPVVQSMTSVKLRYLEEFSELSKILPDSAFSDRCRIEVSRVLTETFSSRRNLCLNFEFFEKWSF